MGTTKNKNTKRARVTQSSDIHNKRPLAKSSRRARSKTFNRNFYFASRKIILSVITLATMAVILTLLFSTFSSHERVIKSEFETIAKDYYENYYYDRVASQATPEKPLAEIMERYERSGFDKVTLRQLLLFDNERHSASAELLNSACDPETTTITITPHAPFSRQDYKITYNYACNY